MGGSDGGTSYQFASSNPMWRATLDILDFLPLANVDYSGGIITTDWYNEGTSVEESIKITIRFLTNEIRADGIKIIVHKKKCNIQQKCSVKKVSSALENELRVAILKKAVIYDKEYKKETQNWIESVWDMEKGANQITDSLSAGRLPGYTNPEISVKSPAISSSDIDIESKKIFDYNEYGDEDDDRGSAEQLVTAAVTSKPSPVEDDEDDALSYFAKLAE